MRTLLSIDADWAVAPTPEPIVQGMSVAQQTLEAKVYDYGADRGKRPLERYHNISVPAQTLARHLWDTGLPKRLPLRRTKEHGQIRDVWGADVLSMVQRLVVLDAHLDLYPVCSLPFSTDSGETHLVHGTVYELVEGAAAQLGLLTQIKAEQIAWIQAWLLLIMPSAPELTTVDWIVPEHFGKALNEGFPYPQAQWQVTLHVGQARELWSYSLNKEHRRITLHLVQPGNRKRRKLRINVRTLAELPDLATVEAPVHLCDSPQYTPPSVDCWTQEIEGTLMTT